MEHPQHRGTESGIRLTAFPTNDHRERPRKNHGQQKTHTRTVSKETSGKRLRDGVGTHALTDIRAEHV